MKKRLMPGLGRECHEGGEKTARSPYRAGARDGASCTEGTSKAKELLPSLENEYFPFPLRMEKKKKDQSSHDGEKRQNFVVFSYPDFCSFFLNQWKRVAV